MAQAHGHRDDDGGRCMGNPWFRPLLQINLELRKRSDVSNGLLRQVVAAEDAEEPCGCSAAKNLPLSEL